MSYNLLTISGSLRKNSTNSGLIRAFIEVAGDSVAFTEADIHDLPIFNEDLEVSGNPEKVVTLKQQIQEADGVLIATPEYNRGTSGALKNALDWSTRPTKENPWEGKPVYIVGASSGTLGTVNAQYDLKRSMLYLKARVLGQPEMYVTFNKTKFNESGDLTDADTKTFIQKALDAFKAHIDQTR